MSKLDRVLAECLDRLARGEATVEECLAHYPEHAAALRRLLAAAHKLESARTIRPSPVFKMRGRAQLVAYMRATPRQSWASRWAIRLRGGLIPAFGRVFNVALNLAAILLLCLVTVTVLAQTALPGDALYRWKVASERAWRAVHPNPLQTDLLLSERRLAELTHVAGDPQAEPLARQQYQQSLAALTGYASPETQELISRALVAQKDDLAQMGLRVPELERLLIGLGAPEAQLQLDNQVATVAGEKITYRLTLANHGPASPVTATLVTQLSAAEKLVSASQANCAIAAEGISCPVDGLTPERPYHLTLTTAVARCYAGVVSNTTTVRVTGNVVNTGPGDRAVASRTIAAPFPREAQIAYVQSSGPTHSLGLVASNTHLLNDSLHVRAAAPAWSPDGTKLAFFGEEGISELQGVYSQGNGVWVVEISRGQAQNPRLLVAQDHVKNIAWSPDGAKLAFEVRPPGLPPEVMVVEAGAGQTLSRFAGEQPAWSPDSQKLVVRAACPSGCGLWLVNLDGSQERQLTFDDSDSYPAWSPDGQYLAFSSRREDADWEIYRLRLAGGELQRLTRRPGSDTTPVFGPCGDNIYLRTDAYGSWWLTVMKLDGSDERQVQAGIGPSDDWGLARPAVY